MLHSQTGKTFATSIATKIVVYIISIVSLNYSNEFGSYLSDHRYMLGFILRWGAEMCAVWIQAKVTSVWAAYLFLMGKSSYIVSSYK